MSNNKNRSTFARKMAARRRRQIALDTIGATLVGACTTFFVYVFATYAVARFGGAL